MYLTKLLAFVVPIFLVLYTTWALLDLVWLTRLSVGAILGVISWTLGHAFYDTWNKETVEEPAKKAVLITGCDTGFGHETAIKLDRFGFTVFAGVLSPEGEGANKLVASCSKRLRILKMDITKQSDVEEAFQAVEASRLSLWAIVNNAGICVGGFLDWGNDVDEYRKVFEVNLFGLVRVTKRGLPLLRETPGSRLVNVASLAARISVPQMGAYCMSKHSVRAFSDTLRRELALTKDKLSVVTIEPTFYRTAIIDSLIGSQVRERIWRETPDVIKAAYPESLLAKMKMLQSLIEKACRVNIHEVVDTLVTSVTLKEPKLFYRCAGYSDLVIWAVSHAPESLLDGLLLIRDRLLPWFGSVLK